jgi:hypothetical protein
MIKTTINEILNVTPVLRELAVKPFKGAMTFKIARLIRELDKETALFEESRTKLAEKYGVRNESGELEVSEEGTIKLQEDRINECNEELTNLLLTDVEINADVLPASAFDEIEISPIQAIALESFIEY